MALPSFLRRKKKQAIPESTPAETPITPFDPSQISVSYAPYEHAISPQPADAETANISNTGQTHSISSDNAEKYVALSEEKIKSDEEQKQCEQAEEQKRIKDREDFLQSVIDQKTQEKEREAGVLTLAWRRINTAPEDMSDYIQNYMQKGPLKSDRIIEIANKIKSETSGSTSGDPDNDDSDFELELELTPSHGLDEIEKQKREALIYDIEHDDQFLKLNEEARRTWEILKSSELTSYYSTQKMHNLHGHLTNEAVLREFENIRDKQNREKTIHELIREKFTEKELSAIQRKNRERSDERGSGRSRGFEMEL